MIWVALIAFGFYKLFRYGELDWLLGILALMFIVNGAKVYSDTHNALGASLAGIMSVITPTLIGFVLGYIGYRVKR